MKICPGCGAEVAASDSECPRCGAALAPPRPPESHADGEDGPERLWLKALLGFVLPPVGFMLAALWRGLRPRSMKAVLAGSVASVAVLASLILYLHSQGAFRPGWA